MAEIDLSSFYPRMMPKSIMRRYGFSIGNVKEIDLSISLKGCVFWSYLALPTLTETDTVVVLESLIAPLIFVVPSLQLQDRFPLQRKDELINSCTTDLACQFLRSINDRPLSHKKG